MTIVVLTPKMILADCRLTGTIQAKDERGKDVTFKGTTDAFGKIGEWNVSIDGVNSEAYAIFGDVEVAQAMVAFIKAVGPDDLDRKLNALGKFHVRLPDSDSGVAWLDEHGVMRWAYLNKSGYIVGFTADTDYVAFGSGADIFRAHALEKHDVMTAFLWAAKEDPQSCLEAYDRFYIEDGVITRFNNPGGGFPAALEQLLKL